MSQAHPDRALFRLWVQLHPQALTFRQMMPMRRETRRFVRSELA